MEHNVGQGGPSKTWNVSLKVGPRQKIRYFTTYSLITLHVGLFSRTRSLYARYLCSRDALGLKARRRRQAKRDDGVSCIQTRSVRYWLVIAR